MPELTEWANDPRTQALLATLVAAASSVFASLLNAVLPNDNKLVKVTRWLALNVFQAKPDAPQKSFKRFITGKLL